jgi:hypothetical protein
MECPPDVLFEKQIDFTLSAIHTRLPNLVK